MSCFICMATTGLDECPLKCGVYGCKSDHIRHHIGQSDLDLASRYCRPFRIGNSPEFGRHFVATRDILPLQEILCEKAAVIGPATQAIQVCLECLIPIELEGDESNFRCSGCNFPMCRAHTVSKSTNFSHTTEECDMLARSNIGLTFNGKFDEKLTHACIFLARMWRLKSKDSSLFESLFQLMSGDTSDITQNGKFPAEIQDVLQIKFGLDDFSLADISRCMGIKRTNANNLDSIDLPGGVALYSVYTLMNHHCNCNSSCLVDPKTFTIRVIAQRQILKGEQITTRYLAPWEGQPLRASSIINHWKFKCQCSRCLDPTDLKTFFSAIKCRSDKCKNDRNEGYFLPINPQLIGTPWKCNNCSVTRGHLQVFISSPIKVKLAVLFCILYVVETLESVESIMNATISSIRDLLPSYKWIPVVISQLQSSLHPNHYIIFKLKKTFSTSLKIKKTTELEELQVAVEYLEDILQIVQHLDPGVTLQRASILKNLAIARLELARRQLDFQGETFRPEFEKQLGRAVLELKKASTCMGSNGHAILSMP